MIPLIYTLSILSITSQPIAMQQFKGKLLLIVNSASGCGFHSQLEELEILSNKYSCKGLEILVVPSNDFFQEPLLPKAIQCSYYKHSSSIITSIPLHVKGKKQHPLYKLLTKKNGVYWNYTKFLISENGEILKRFYPWQKPTSSKCIAVIEKYLPKQIDLKALVE